MPEGDTLPRTVCGDCGTIHYQNPKIVVGCLPEWQGHVLLCKRAIEPRLGLWTLPAGFLENGETIEAIVRGTRWMLADVARQADEHACVEQEPDRLDLEQNAASEDVLAKLRAYQAEGIEAFILSGYPHVNEADMFARYVLPHIQHGPLTFA